MLTLVGVLVCLSMHLNESPILYSNLGRHACVGVKMAKLQMKLVLALMLLGYEYELVDGSGKYPASFPQPDRNDIQQVSSRLFSQKSWMTRVNGSFQCRRGRLGIHAI